MDRHHDCTSVLSRARDKLAVCAELTTAASGTVGPAVMTLNDADYEVIMVECLL